MPAFQSVYVRLAQANLEKLAGIAFCSVGRIIAPPNQLENLPGRSLHRVNVFSDGVRNLKGDGMNMGVWDERDSPHLDFCHRAV